MSLDIPEAQVLVRFDDDNIPWHHRELIHKVEGATWAVSTPDFDVESINLSDYAVRALARNAPMSVGIGQIYA